MSRPVLFLTHAPLDQIWFRQAVAMGFTKGDESKFFQLIQGCDSDELAKNYYMLKNARQILEPKLDSKDDYRETLLRLYEDYPQPVLLFLGDVSQLSLAAQEGMLRLLEEPPRNLRIILNSPTKNILLPTILSRVSTSLVPINITINHLDEQLQQAVKNKLPAVGDFTKSLIQAQGRLENLSLPDLSKVERDELSLWLWQIQMYLEQYYKQNPQFNLAKLILINLSSQKLNQENLQKKLALGQIKYPIN